MASNAPRDRSVDSELLGERTSEDIPQRPTTPASPQLSPSTIMSWGEGKKHSKWRHTLGIVLLMVVVVLWTASNFLGSTIFADNTYAKPYFVTYINTAFFIFPLIPFLIRQAIHDPSQIHDLKNLFRRKSISYDRIPVSYTDTDDDEEADSLMRSHRTDSSALRNGSPSARMLLEDSLGRSESLPPPGSSFTSDKLTLRETAKLSFEFCILWFIANYFVSACLEYTTVASATILSSTSSIFTLMIGAMLKVEVFSLKKLMGVLASLGGIVLISLVDVNGSDDKDRGTFPHKSPGQIALGDALALFSAILYGLYTVLLKVRIGDESRINMSIFFGLVGVTNVLVLWPGLIILHLFGIETFELPPTERVVWILVLNSVSSLIADFCWAWAIMLTSPLVVTVGLSLTIPVSLVGEMVLSGQYESWIYWFGALIVLCAFVFINREESKDEEVVDARLHGDNALSSA